MRMSTQLWGAPGYRQWFTADTATAAGVALRTLAVSLAGYAVSGSMVAAGWLGTASMIMQQVFNLFGGTFVDRHDRKTLICINASVGLLCWGSVTVLMVTGTLSFPLLLIITAAASGVNGLLGSATDAMLKSIINIRDYPKARSINEGRDALVNMAGSPISGFLYGLGPWVPFLTATVMYALAGVAATRIPAPRPAAGQGDHGDGAEPTGEPERGEAHGGNSFMQDLVEGWAWTLRRRTLIVIFLAAGLLNFGVNGIQYAIQLHLIANGTNTTFIGFVSGGIFLAMLVGAAAASRLSNVVSVGAAVCVTFVFICIAALPMVFTDNYWIILVANSILGLPFPMVNATLLGFVFAKTPAHMQGRVAATLNVPTQALTAFCSAAAGAMLPTFGFCGTILAFLAVMVFSAVLVMAFPPIRTIPKADQWAQTEL